MKLLVPSFLLLFLQEAFATRHLRHSKSSSRHRGLLLEGEPYYTTSDPAILGAPNTLSALGNPLKGLIGGARWANPPLPDNVPLTMEWYNIGVSLQKLWYYFYESSGGSGKHPCSGTEIT